MSPAAGRRGLLPGLAGLALLYLAATAAAGPVDDYRTLREQRYGCRSELPEGGLSWSDDTATWHFDTGHLERAEPVADGRVTGWLFEGSGRFTWAVPDAIERQALARFAGRPAGERFEVAFTAVLVRANEAPFGDLPPADGDCGAYAVAGVAAERHAEWLDERLLDVDARIAAALANPGDRYLRVAFDTADHGWMVYQHDALNAEEIDLTVERAGFLETWVSLDRAEDRRPDGRPGAAQPAWVDVTDADLTVDLDGTRERIAVGLSGTEARRVATTARLTFTPLVSGPRALPIALSPLARLTAVRGPDGGELPVLRHQLGADTERGRDDLASPLLFVVLDRPLAAGESRRLDFEYELLIVNYTPGRTWYPSGTDTQHDRHTATLTVLHRRKLDVRATGRLLEETEADGRVRSVWRVERPTWAASFSFGEGFREETLEFEGVPTVRSFGTRLRGGAIGNMRRNVGADVVNSLRFLQWFLDHPLTADEIQLTSIAAGHGQSFDGFIQMSEATYHSEDRGTSELFRAHETAHQWWGHEIGWESYRDQWLSESLAEYSAMLYVQTAMQRGEAIYDEIVAAYGDMLLGAEGGRSSKFDRPWLTAVSPAALGRLGPICLGLRASTAEIPWGYTLQVYYKGPLVLHMLRSTLARVDPGRDLFRAALQDFVARHAGGTATTADFVAAVERHAPGDWDWFFDQWLCGTALPTYTWDHSATADAETGGWTLALDVEQTGVPDGFRMPVPVRVVLDDGRESTFPVMIDQKRQTIRLPLPGRPAEVELNADRTVLARVERR